MDIFDLAPDIRGNVQKFTGGATSASSSSWQTWTKPQGCSMMSLTLIGGGGGGGGGYGGAAGAGKGGGGGGGSSGISRYIYPLNFIPDTLYVLVGQGGTGGAGGSSGNGSTGVSAQTSYVAIYPNGVSNNLIGISGGGGAGAGNGGIAGSAVGGGSAGIAASLTNAPFSCYGQAMFTAGINGGTGGSGVGAVGGSITFSTAGQIGPGCGGGGSTSADFNGGAYAALANTPFLATTAASGGAAGHSGFTYGKFPLYYGGGGGGASNSTTGGAGGNGGMPGTGGGGGGGGVTTGGAGGRGADGMVLIVCW